MRKKKGLKMPTNVHVSRIFNQSFLLVTENRHMLFVESFCDGVATIIFTSDYVKKENEFAKIIFGCFDEDSNFSNILRDIYRCSYTTFFKGISVRYVEKEVFLSKTSSMDTVLKEIKKLIKDETNFLKDCNFPIYWVSPYNLYIPSKQAPFS